MPNPNPIRTHRLLHLSSGNPKKSTPVISSVAKKAEAVNLIHCPSQTRLLMDMVRYGAKFRPWNYFILGLYQPLEKFSKANSQLISLSRTAAI